MRIKLAETIDDRKKIAEETQKRMQELENNIAELQNNLRERDEALKSARRRAATTFMQAESSGSGSQRTIPSFED